MKYLLVAVFLVVIAGIFFGMHYYVIGRVSSFFGPLQKVWLYALILALLYPLATIIDRTLHSPPTVVLYYIASVLAGIFFISFFILLLFEAVNLQFPVFEKSWAGLAVIAIVSIISIAGIVSAMHLSIKEVEVEGFGKEMKIVQLSDVHIGTIKNNAFLERVVKKTNSLNPDAVVITGDLFDGSGKLNATVLEPLMRLNAPVYMVMGNHEFYEGEERVIELMKQTNVTILRNSAVQINGIQLAGLDYTENKSYVELELSRMKLNYSIPTILLLHVPIGYEEAKSAGVKMQLSGHTHAGQIFPFTIAVKLAFPKYKGLYNLDGFHLYVSQGTGTWGPPMRIGTTGEITLIHLKK